MATEFSDVVDVLDVIEERSARHVMIAFDGFKHNFSSDGR